MQVYIQKSANFLHFVSEIVAICEKDLHEIAGNEQRKKRAADATRSIRKEQTLNTRFPRARAQITRERAICQEMVDENYSVDLSCAEREAMMKPRRVL